MGEPLSEVIKIRLTQLKCQLVSHEQELALINRERMDLMNGIVAKNKREAVLEVKRTVVTTVRQTVATFHTLSSRLRL